MPLSSGTRLGPYEIVSALGAGGMGEVYRAKDLKLKRDVAIKVLPDAFSRDPDRVARFQREAEVLASLNHPHIAAIHELAESGGAQFLVLELVEGETLAHRIARGPVPIDESLAIAKQIAEALEAAHDRGIIHRDLKPTNIMLTARGAPPPRAEDRHLERRFSAAGDDPTVKVLDFGLAKVRDSELTYASLTQSPTMMAPSASGVILGTAAYMSPEQAKGKDADRTSDVWAFGCVLYEMLSGRRAFEGETVSELLAEVLKTEPDWQRVPADTPPAIRRLLRRCLRKDRKHRLHDIADARLEIEEVGSEPDSRVPAARPAPRRIERVAWISAVVLLSFVAAVAIAWAVWPMARPPEMRLDINTPPTTDPVSLALSPNGQKIAFVAMSEGRPVLWLRSLESTSAGPLPGTDNASFPFWSPDARSIGFFADSRLKRIDIDGGSVQVLANAPVGRGGTWNADGVILYAPSGAANPIFRVAATGGEPVAVTRINAPEQNGHVLPQFLPDGRRFIYYVSGSPAARGIYVGQIEGSESQRLLDVGSPAVFAASGYLLFTRQGALYAQPIDGERLQLSGTAFSVAAQVATATVVGVSGIAALSASAAGPIVFRAGLGGSQRQLMWVDRLGKAIGNVGDADTAGLVNPAISPDGRRVALQRNVGGNTDVWLLETARAVLTRFTFDAATDGFPI